MTPTLIPGLVCEKDRPRLSAVCASTCAVYHVRLPSPRAAASSAELSTALAAPDDASRAAKPVAASRRVTPLDIRFLQVAGYERPLVCSIVVLGQAVKETIFQSDGRNLP